MPWKKAKGGGRKTKRGGWIKRPKVYEGLKRRGLSKKRAAKIANSKDKK